jgi:hypothetical protein
MTAFPGTPRCGVKNEGCSVLVGDSIPPNDSNRGSGSCGVESECAARRLLGPSVVILGKMFRDMCEAVPSAVVDGGMGDD